MRYLTKEWYETCQRTGLHFGMEILNEAAAFDEALYLQLYKIKETEFVKMEEDIYNVNPAYMLEQDGSIFIPVDKFENGEEVKEEDKIVYYMPEEEKKRIQKLIDEYNERPPFDKEKATEQFRFIQETIIKESKEKKIPAEIFQQIADVRVFNLGYCTKEIMEQLIKLSDENNKKMEQGFEEYRKAWQKEDIPQEIRDKFGFHDCKVVELTENKDIVMRLNTNGGFTEFNKITFVKSDAIKQDDNIVGSFWIYNELYRTEKGYEVHILFSDSEVKEMTLCCSDIIVEKE